MSNTRVSSTLCHFNILYFTLCGIITLPTACTRSLCTVCTVCTVADVKSQEFLLAKYLISLNKMLKHVLYLFSDKQENAHNVYQ